MAVSEVEALYRLEIIPEPGLPHPKNAQGAVVAVVVEQATMVLVVLGVIILTLLVGLRPAITTQHAHNR